MSNELELNKDRADADCYYKLFADKVGRFKDGERILFIHIGNFDVLDRFIQSNKNCSYFIIDQYLNGPWFEMSWDCKFIGTNEDDSIVKALETLDMKFDKIIMNPPYSQTLHLQILEEAIKHLNDNGICVNLSPVRWLQDMLIQYNLSTCFNKYKKSICEKIENLNVIEHETANKIFGISHGDLGIYFCKNNAKKFDIEKISEINKSIKIILDKLYVKNIYWRMTDFSFNKTKMDITKSVNHIINKINKKFEYFILINRINGAINAKWQTNIIRECGILNKKELYQFLINNPSQKKIMGFTKEEINSAKNIFNLLDKNCLRFGLALTQDSQAMVERCYTFFPDIDYSNIKTEQDFYKYFNITKDEQKLIEETMEKYK